MLIDSADIEGFQCIRRVQVAPGECAVFYVGGKNEQGKTSLFTAIKAATGGKTEIPENPVLDGEPYADIRLALSGDKGSLKIHRRIFPDGRTTLTVKDGEGKTQKKAQQLLNELRGACFLDPLEFVRQTQKKQLETLLSCVKVDINLLEHNAAHRVIYTERAGYNEDKKKLKVKMEEAEDSTPIPDEIDPSEVSHKLTKIIEKIAGQDAEAKELEHTLDTLDEREAELARIEARALELRPEILRLSAERERLAALYDGHVPLEDLTREKAEAEDRVQVASEMNAERAVLVEQRRMRGLLAEELRGAERNAERCTAKMKALDAKKAKAMSEAEFPVEGLGFNEHGVTFDGHPLSSASAARKIRIALALACKMSADMRDIYITDASLLDDDSLQAVIDFAEAKGFRVWLEVVGEDHDDAIIIREGRIVALKSEAA